MSNQLQSLTKSEEQIMQYIWENGEMYFRDIVNAFPEPKPHQNTVSTFLKILVDKNYLTTKKDGRIFLYSPNIKYDNYKKNVLKSFLENYFNNSGDQLLELLIEENLINKNQLESPDKPKTQKESNPIKDLIEELTGDKKAKKKKDKKKKKHKKNKKGDH